MTKSKVKCLQARFNDETNIYFWLVFLVPDHVIVVDVVPDEGGGGGKKKI